jgi:hypothetical protein
MASMLQRTAAAAACALLLACPASAQLIGSGHVMGNGASSPASPTDTQLLGVMNQSGSGITFGGTTRKLATVSGAIANGHCRSTDANGNDIDAGGACTVGGGGGTVSPATIPATGPAPVAIYTGSPGSSSTVGGFASLPLGNGGSASGATNVTAYASFLAALPTQGGCLQLGAGSYSFSGVLTASLPASLYNISILGTGINSTELLWSSGGGMTFNFTNPKNSVHGSDFSMVTGASGGSAAIRFYPVFRPGEFREFNLFEHFHAWDRRDRAVGLGI